MDPAAFATIEHAIRTELTAEQCLQVERLARETSATKAIEALIGQKGLALSEQRRCPRCGAGGVLRHGHDANGRQRFRCRRAPAGCGRTFNGLTGTALARMRKPESWLAYAQALCDQRSLAWIHHALGIARLTAWRWRHRLLRAIAAVPGAMVAGIVEADETFFLRAFKGHRGWKRGQPPENRPPRYRGSGALKRGLSSEQVPVVTAVDRNGGVAEAVLDSRSTEPIIAALRERIATGSLICSDGLAAYPRLAEAIGGEHRVIEPPNPTPAEKAEGLPWRSPGALTLGRVNAHHADLKTAINRHFKGVSTCHLPNYLAWLRLVRRSPPPLAFLAAA